MNDLKGDNYSVRKLPDIHAFLEHTSEWLKADEENNNSLIACAQAIEKKKPAYDGPKWFGCIEKHGEIIGCFMHTELDGLMTSDLPSNAVPPLCDSLEEWNFEVSKINGPSDTIVVIAEELGKRESHATWQMSHAWQCYKLDNLIWPKTPVKGYLRHAEESERYLIRAWGKLYGEEKPAPIPVPDFLLGKVDDGDLYIWDDDGAKMLLCVSGKTEKTARISAVYTPHEYRRRGYASIAVATITKELLDDGRSYTTLLVDDDDEPVKRIYERLGYQKTRKKANIVIGRKGPDDS